MRQVKVKDVELYFVLRAPKDCPSYDLVGMTYSEEAALDLKKEQSKKGQDCNIVMLDLGTLLYKIKEWGVLKEIG
ncbi:MAG: hypothetical protein L0Y56_06220 [Nitrospira sp.]|nr:hypothetical protein [Nitrospira sp.]